MDEPVCNRPVQAWSVYQNLIPPSDLNLIIGKLSPCFSLPEITILTAPHRV